MGVGDIEGRDASNVRLFQVSYDGGLIRAQRSCQQGDDAGAAEIAVDQDHVPTVVEGQGRGPEEADGQLPRRRRPGARGQRRIGLGRGTQGEGGDQACKRQPDTGKRDAAQPPFR
ncbi:hypothetical protein D3C72_2047160 [compost metagenome]